MAVKFGYFVVHLFNYFLAALQGRGSQASAASALLQSGDEARIVLSWDIFRGEKRLALL